MNDNVLVAAQGKELTAACRAAYAEVSASAEKLGMAEYNFWDLTGQVCKEDIIAFMDLLRELDLRLAAVILQVSKHVKKRLYMALYRIETIELRPKMYFLSSSRIEPSEFTEASLWW